MKTHHSAVLSQLHLFNSPSNFSKDILEDKSILYYFVCKSSDGVYDRFYQSKRMFLTFFAPVLVKVFSTLMVFVTLDTLTFTGTRYPQVFKRKLAWTNEGCACLFKVRVQLKTRWFITSFDSANFCRFKMKKGLCMCQCIETPVVLHFLKAKMPKKKKVK